MKKRKLTSEEVVALEKIFGYELNKSFFIEISLKQFALNPSDPDFLKRIKELPNFIIVRKVEEEESAIIVNFGRMNPDELKNISLPS